MTKKELAAYVRQQLSQGVNPEVLKFVLTSDGWADKDVAEIMREAAKPATTTETAPIPAKPIASDVPTPRAAAPVPAKASQKAVKTEAAASPANPAALAAVLPGPVPALPEAAKSRPYKKWLLAGGLTLLVLLLGGGGAYAFYYRQTPEYVLNRAMASSAQVKTFEYALVLSGTGNLPVGLEKNMQLFLARLDETPGKVAGAITPYQGTVVINGRADISNPDDPRSESIIQIESQPLKLSIESRMVDKKLYVKASNLPALAGLNFEKLVNTWLMIDLASLKESSGSAISLPTQVSEEDVKGLRNDLWNYQILKLKGRTKENLEGVPAYHYIFEVDKNELRKYLSKEAQGFAGSEATKGLDSSYESITFSPIDVWIGRQDYLLRKAKAGVAIKDQGSDGQLNLELTVGNYNQPITITAPASFKDFGQALKEATAETMAKAQDKSRDARRLFEIRQIQTGLELYYNDFGKYPRQLSELAKNTKASYLYAIPTAPMPPAAGCTEAQNLYAYKQLKQGKSYSLTFCLGPDAAGYQSGVRTASPEGIN